MTEQTDGRRAEAIIIPFPAVPHRPLTAASHPADLVPLNFRVEVGWRQEFTGFCRRHGLERREALRRAFELLREEVEA